MPPCVANLSGNKNNKGNLSFSKDDRPQSSPASTRARQLGVDVVEYSHPKNLYTLSMPIFDVILYDDVDIVMRKIVKKIIREKQPLFHGMIQSVRPSNYADFKNILGTIVEHLVEGTSSGRSNLTWGKIVTAYAFGGVFANDVITSCAAAAGGEIGAQQRRLDAKELGNIVGEVIDGVAGSWIQEQGGWDSFVDFFSSINAEESLTRNLVYLFGASAAAAVGLAFWKART